MNAINYSRICLVLRVNSTFMIQNYHLNRHNIDFKQLRHLFSDDAMEDCGFLKFTDETLKVSLLQTLNTMRKHRLFCDVVINVSQTSRQVDRGCHSLYTFTNDS